MSTQPLGNNRIDRAISAGTKACEIAEQKAIQRSNERASIVVSNRNGQSIVVTEDDFCSVEFARSVADEKGEPCGNRAYVICEKCGQICQSCAEALCWDGKAHEITEERL